MSARDRLALGLVQQDAYALIVLDAQARIVDWPGAAARIFGYERREMLGESLARILPPEDLARGVLEWELNAARSYGKSEDDRWHVRKDGVRIWVTGVITAVRDDSGALAGYLKVARDRTDLKAHMEALQVRLNQASELQNQKHVLLGSLAHELRNPLDPLRSAAQLIRRAAVDGAQVESYVQIIERQIRFIDGLLKDVLESTRASAGKMSLHPSCFPLRAVIDAAVETCSSALRERGQSVQTLLAEDLVLEADPVRLQQVLVNLIGNSSKFSPDASSIWIKASVDGDMLVLRVEDYGRGIPAQTLPRIFDLFTQSDAEGGTATEGLGLGLGLVKSIVELHNGTVHARSDGPGQGTEICVRLPLRIRPQAQPSAG